MKIKFLALMIFSIFSAQVIHAAPVQNFTQSGRDPFAPLYQSSNEPPLNMLVVGKDHRLFYEAYNDASDLDGDGIYDVGYQGWQVKPSFAAVKGNFKIDYYGYFDSYKCYQYTGGRFEPIEITTNKKCLNNGSAPWSGDFLNYLTTSRIDAIRRVLYGGKRSKDTATETELERAFIPQDAHSWGKEYQSVANDGYNITEYTPMALPTGTSRHLFANTTMCTTSNPCSTSFNNPPLLRTITNSPRRIWEWLSIERPVADAQYADGSNNRVNIPTADMTNYNVRVQVCKTGLLETECKKYGTSFKPFGLIQQYGDADSMRFGLMSGSYSSNTQGGVLRKNISTIDDEVDITNGTFKAAVGVIRSIDNFRVEGFANSREWFGVSANDGECSYANAFAKQLINGSCSGWGNPVGEMMWETMRYFSGANANLTTDAKGNALGLSVAAWTNPYGSNNGVPRNSVCAKPVITLLSDINPSFDDGISNASLNGNSFNQSNALDKIWQDEFGSGAKSVVIGSNGSNNDLAPTVKTATTFANLKGLPDEPGKSGTFATAAVAQFGRINDINAVAEKQLVSTFAIALSSPLPKIEVPVNGKNVIFTPFAKSPSNGGGTGTAANYRPTNQIVDYYIDKIRNVPGFPTDLALNGGRPYYKFRINFEDVEYGGDHDMDAIAEYTIQLQSDNTILVTVDSTYAAGGIDQHMGYVVSGSTKDGVYLVVKDVGGANVNYWMDAKPATVVLGKPTDSGAPISPIGNLTALTDSRIFAVNSTSATVTDLKSPLWYAAKYGGFVDDDEDTSPNKNVIDNDAEWDVDGDKIPDNYFLVTNPLKLKEQLDRAFSRIDATSRSSAPVGSAAGGSSTSSDFRIYRTAYKAKQWSGNLSALSLSTSTLQLGTVYWDANDPSKLLSPVKRVLMTWNPDTRTGTAFDSAAGLKDLSSNQKAALNYPSGDPGGSVVTPVMAARANYIRGDNSNEGTVTGKFRAREKFVNQTNYIADILDAQPYAVGPVGDENYYSDAGYKTFAGANKDRTNFVYAGANGGVFHAFMDDVVTNQTNNGTERFGYIPSFVFDKLRKLEDQSYNHEYFLNGQAAVQDVKIGSNWSTLLIATAGFGGKGVFALDITTPLSVNSTTIPSTTRWEYFNTTNTTQGSPDMGYQPYSPLISKMNDGKWYAIIGNGFNSDNGNAALFLLDVAGPGSGWNTTTAKKILIDATLAGTGVNGLSAPTAADLDNNGTADVIYAGDMLGNLWKFDVKSADPANWKLGLASKPLFKATRTDGAQSIVSPPAVAFEKKVETALSIVNKRLMVYFGTGKFSEDCDRFAASCSGQSNVASFYGIVDKEEQLSSTGAASGDVASFASITSSKLIQQKIQSYNSNDLIQLNKPGLTLSDIENYRCILPKKVDGSFQANCTDENLFKNVSVEFGWYIDYTLAEERSVGMPRIAGNTILFNTLIPYQDLTNQCSFTARSALMALNLDDGGQTRQRFEMTNSSDKSKVSAPNVGLISSTSSPNGTTTVEGATPSGLNDERGFGRDYNHQGVKPCKKAIDVDPSGKGTGVKVCDSRVVVPINWTEVIR
ncbi:pilus assembly protein [Deefgea salmonis]|uniref:PilY1 beta-propeller domain-containing protein n=1 Tax=Deefgea salmonis TaxID=2875502 RepID=A0ABS8BMJ9_9NEIS|nr:PilC/PilY family type IV pilus protein [Deefgea salmonis]MCB5196962.1 hypothetical protein [Deefgea salmonis]